VRIFVDEGAAMNQLLSTAKAKNIMPGYCDKLLATIT